MKTKYFLIGLACMLSMQIFADNFDGLCNNNIELRNEYKNIILSTVNLKSFFKTSDGNEENTKCSGTLVKSSLGNNTKILTSLY